MLDYKPDPDENLKDCLHDCLKVTGCPFKWYCRACQKWITFSFGKFDPCVEKWCQKSQCHNFGKPMKKDRILTQILEQFYNVNIFNAIELGKKLAGYLPAQLEVLTDEELLVVREGARRVSTLDLSTPIWGERCQRDTTQATIAKNSKEQLYRRVE